MKTTLIFIFAFILIIGGIKLFNFSPPTITPTIAPTTIPTPEPTKSNTKTQIIKATYGPPLGFFPTELIVKVGIPVQLEVYAAENGRGCMSTITIPNFTQEVQTFVKGQTNIFEFTPQTLGEFPITCAMGVPHGLLIVK